MNETANTTTSYGSLDNVSYIVLNPRDSANVSVNIAFVDLNRLVVVSLSHSHVPCLIPMFHVSFPCSMSHSMNTLH